MKPTILKSEAKKRLAELRDEDNAHIHIPGAEPHWVWSRGDDLFLCAPEEYSADCGSDGYHIQSDLLSPDTEIVVTESRPMEVRDIKQGDCFVVCSGGMPGGTFFIALKDGDCAGYASVLAVTQGGVEKKSLGFRGDEVALVTPTFEAEEARGAKTIPLHAVSPANDFILGGVTGRLAECPDGKWTHVAWRSGNQDTSWIPQDTPVAVETSPAYESWDDIEIGDVFIPTGPRATEKSGIYTGNKRSVMSGLTYTVEMTPFGCGTTIRNFAPARLTLVTCERIPEVTR